MPCGNKVTLVQLFLTPATDIGARETDSKIIRFLAERPAHTAKWLCHDTDQCYIIGRTTNSLITLAVA
jgi:hypothetical protein